jgi:homoserine kinase
VRVTVPASSANLGPGYDAFGLALALYNEFEASLAPSWQVTVTGEGACELDDGAENQVVRAMAAAFAEAGVPDTCATVVCRNAIPLGQGLGSSAAAIVGGLVLGDALTGGTLGRDRLLELAVAMEGHADNVAAALFGGFTVATGANAGALTCARVDPAGGLAAVVALGAAGLPTAEARAALPATVTHADATAAAGRAAIVALGIARGEPDLLAAGMRDTLHEPYRRALVPDLDAVRSVFEACWSSPAVLSGAGPTVLALVSGAGDDDALRRARGCADAVRVPLAALGRTDVRALPVDRAGARVV